MGPKPKCKKCGNLMEGHPQPKGDACTLPRVPGFQPTSPPPDEESYRVADHIQQSPPAGTSNGTEKGGDGDKDKEGESSGLDKLIQEASQEEARLQSALKDLTIQALTAEKERLLEEKSRAVLSLQKQLDEAKARIAAAKSPLPSVETPPSASHQSTPAVPAHSTRPGDTHLSYLRTASLAYGSAPDLHAASTTPVASGATLQSWGTSADLKTRASSTSNIPSQDYNLKPEDVIRANDQASAMAGLGSAKKASTYKDNAGKLPEQFLLKPGIAKVDIHDVTFPEFCNGYARMIKSMVNDPLNLLKRINYFIELTSLAMKYEWEDVIDFHEVACQEVEFERADWHSDLNYVKETTVERATKKGESSQNKAKGKKSKNVSQLPEKDVSNEVCNNYNFKDVGCTFPRCKRKHVCFHCWNRDGSENKGHTANACSHKPKTQ